MKPEEQVRKILQDLTAQDFLKVGLDQIAYIKPVEEGSDAGAAFSIHAADGSEIVRIKSMDMAMAAIRHNALHAVTLH